MGGDDFMPKDTSCHHSRTLQFVATAMSVTTTANPVSGDVLQALTDYDLHHSGNPEEAKTPEAPNERSDSSPIVDNPDNWDDEHRRVPPYRPVDPSLRGPERPDGANAIEAAFIFTMLRGVGVISVRCLENATRIFC